MKKHIQSCMVLLALCASYFPLQALAQSLTEAQKDKHPADYGRLFYTQNQRQQLDAQRHAPLPQHTRIKLSSPQAPILPTRTAPVTLNGYVKRSDGKSTVWVNQQPIQENVTLDGIQIGQLNRQPESQKGRKSASQTEKLNIRIPENNQHIQLKAGQQFDPKNNQVKEITTVAKEKQLQLSESSDAMTEIE